MAFDDEKLALEAAKKRNLSHSIILVGGIGAITVVCAWVLWGANGVLWSFVAIVLLLLLSPRIAPEVIMRMYNARRIRPEDGAPIAFAVKELAKRAELSSPPELYVIPSSVINAFATHGESGTIIAVTQGLLNRLDSRELVGVLAHETAHIRHKDLWIMNLADTMSRFTYFMSMMGVLLFLFSLPLALMGGQPIPFLGILLLYFAPTATGLLQLGLSRAREYDADLEGARLAGDTEGLARALEKIETFQGRAWETIFLPGRNVPVPSLLRTHPPTNERIARLRAVSRLQRQPLSVQALDSFPSRFAPWRPRPRYHLTGLWY